MLSSTKTKIESDHCRHQLQFLLDAHSVQSFDTIFAVAMVFVYEGKQYQQ